MCRSELLYNKMLIFNMENLTTSDWGNGGRLLSILCNKIKGADSGAILLLQNWGYGSNLHQVLGCLKKAPPPFSKGLLECCGVSKELDPIHFWV